MKFLVRLLLIFSLAFNFYLYKRVKEIQNSNQVFTGSRSVPAQLKSVVESIQKNKQLDTVEVQQSSIQREEVLEDIPRDLSEEFRDEMPIEQQVSIDEVMENFEIASRDFIETNLKVSSDVFQTYQTIKESFYKERSDFFEKNKQYFVPEAGEDIIVPPQTVMLEQNKILSKHLDKLKEVFGNEGLKLYMAFVHRYNQELIRRTPVGDAHIIIGF